MHALLVYIQTAYAYATDGKTTDSKGSKDIPLLKGSVMVADGFCNDFSLLKNFGGDDEVFLVVRHKEDLNLTLSNKWSYLPISISQR